VGGAYTTTEKAQQRMTGVKPTIYRPARAAAAVYAELYDLYRSLHDAFGTMGYQGDVYRVMKDLITIRDRARGKG